jgi:uracil-DNA glycosylase family 4
MRNALHALTDELRRLKHAGVKTVAVSDESIAALRRVVAARRAAAPEVGKPETRDRKLESGLPSPVSRPLPPAPRPPSPVIATPPAPTLPPPPAFTLPEGDKPARWAALLDTVINDPTCKANVRPGKKVVLGVGTLDARIMFVGEAPGAEEEIHGEPFVGPAGQLLTKMIQAMGLKRSDVYIGNIMNWRPQMPTVEGREQVGNRPPNEEEMRYCLPYLRAQIEVVNPELLVALGSTAAQGLLGVGSFKALGDIRGRWHTFADKPLMVTYHPSYILRNQSNRSKRMIWEDLLKVMERAALPVTEKQRGFFLDK